MSCARCGVLCAALGAALVYMLASNPGAAARSAAERAEREAEAAKAERILALMVADSLRAEARLQDELHRVRMEELNRGFASLDSATKAHERNAQRIDHAPGDSLPAIVRGLLATGRRLGYITR